MKGPAGPKILPCRVLIVPLERGGDTGNDPKVWISDPFSHQHTYHLRSRKNIALIVSADMTGHGIDLKLLLMVWTNPALAAHMNAGGGWKVRAHS